jgi:hypothetical protein
MRRDLVLNTILYVVGSLIIITWAGTCNAHAAKQLTGWLDIATERE